MLQAVKGVRELSSRYDAYFVDLWGVLFDGTRIFPQAAACLARLREEGKVVIVLSNAPRRAHSVQEQIRDAGLPPELYSGVMTSGEATWRLLHDDVGGKLPPPYYYLGPKGGRHQDDLLVGIETTENLEDAGSVLLAGARGDGWGTDFPAGVLERAAERGLKMLCANPDLEVMRGGVREKCSGATAYEYEQLGGTVYYIGKPHPEIYELCFAELKKIAGRDTPKEKILAVGDGLKTDILGANQASIDSLFVASGIHSESLEVNRMETLCQSLGAMPDYLIPALIW